MTARLPTIGNDTNNWGTVLNQFLQVGHNADGTLSNAMKVINVKDDIYGAKGDGSTDDTTAIANAVTAAGNAGGGTVYFPPGTYITTTITLPNRVWLRGVGMRASVIKLKNSTNNHVIKNFVSPDGIVANAEFCGVLDLMIDGNKANQSGTSHGIFFSTFPTNAAATNDDEFDSHHIVENVFIQSALTDGYHGTGRANIHLYNVEAFQCGNDGFSPSFDTFLVGCSAGQSGRYGFNISSSNDLLTNCVSFYSGQTTPSLGYGFYLNNSVIGVTLANCIAQDNKAVGFVFDTVNQCSLVGGTADSNSTSSAGTYPGLDFWNSGNCLVEGLVCVERKADGTNSWQTHALRIRSNSTGNRISLTHSGANGAVVSTPIDSGSTSLAGNDLRINSQEAYQNPAYAASITPDPYTGSIIEVTLTGNITINAPTNGPYHPGCPLTFVFIQDSVGGHSMTFNAVFKTNWTPVMTASNTNTIQFTYDGTNWWQQSSITGMGGGGGGGVTDTLSLSTTSMAFTGTVSGSNPASQTVTLSNAGSTSAAYTTASSQGWLTVAPTSGTVTANSNITSTLSVNIAGLTSGANLDGTSDYIGTITYTGPVNTVVVTVDLTMHPAVSSTSVFPSTTHPYSVPANLATAFPYKTNAWWEQIFLGPMAVPPNTENFAPDPYLNQVVSSGLYVCYPVANYYVDGTGLSHIVDTFLKNMTLEMNEGSPSFAITAYDELTCTVTWTAGGHTMTSYIAQGSPYATMTYATLTPLIKTTHVISSVNGGSTPGAVTGTTFKVVLNNGQTWKIYASSSLTLTWSNTGGWQLLASSTYTGTLRIALIKNVGDETVLDTGATIWPTASTVTASYGTNTATYTFTWATTGTGTLLMMAYPHHQDILSSPTYAASLDYWAIKGKMKGVLGATWNLVETWPAWVSTWQSSRVINATYTSAITAQLNLDKTYTGDVPGVETYFYGKGIAKMARLAMIADELGQTITATTIRNNIKSSMNQWLNGTNGSDKLEYDTTWGGVVDQAGITGITISGSANPNFGFGKYNDHVFHLGYWAYAAGVVGRGDTAWLASQSAKLTELVHDYCNPLGSGDTKYPLNRNKDWFAGHSWASGLTPFADGEDIESTSEAINGYYGMAILGDSLGDTAMKNQGLLMMAMEIRSANKYWKIYSGNNPYTNPNYLSGGTYAANGIGMMWSDKVDDATWFNADLIARRFIQIIPLLPITELYVPSGWVSAMVSSGEMATMLTQGGGPDAGYMVGPQIAKVVVDSQATAWTNVTGLAASQLDPPEGQSMTNMMYWVATRA